MILQYSQIHNKCDDNILYPKMKQGQMTIKPSILFSNVTDIWSQLYRYINQIHRTFGTF